MRRFVSTMVCALVITGILAGCSTRIGDFTTISTKNVEIGGKYVKTGTFEGEDIAWIILIIPTGIPNLKTAVDRCLENGGGELATNAVLSTEWMTFILAGSNGYSVKADVWKRATMGDLADPTKEIFELNLRPDGGHELTSVTNSNIRYKVFDKNKDAYSQLAISK